MHENRKWERSKRKLMINQRELEILNILWRSPEPVMVTEIIDADETKNLTQSTVTAVIRKLLNSDLVEVCGVKHSGKVLSRTYKPTEKSRDIIVENILDMYRTIRHVVPPNELAKIIKERL